MTVLAAADLVVLSHLRWDWVWQRPQHLISRAAAQRRTWFVEEPRPCDVPSPVVRVVPAGPVTRVWLDTPQDAGINEFSQSATELYIVALTELLGDRGRDVWLYAPTAIAVAEFLEPRLLIYDVMDDLASFADAPPEMTLRMRRALTTADVAFTGGRSLHRGAVAVRGAQATHLFPSGVECAHYARSRNLRRPHPRRVAGYVGVIDERLDLPLIAGLAAALPDWDLHMVGPTTKIDPATLPQAENIVYQGMQRYEDLPRVMAAFDVALMPFALNEATRSISPTKTLEYLAAGLPVVSTRVPDVVADWSEVVHLADDATAFAAGCRIVVGDPPTARDSLVAPLRRRYEWDFIAAGMLALLEETLAKRAGRPKAAEAGA
ncbi:MAG TPA: glycosyltransferase [Sporichthya sp.]|nr:glycosyltransferase [Sporichthya sp.]